MKKPVSQGVLVVIVIVLLLAAVWFVWSRLIGRYHRTEPPTQEPSLPRVERLSLRHFSV